MATRYWVGGTGNWSSTTKWSTTSGGASGASVPGAADTAIFDTNSDTAAADFTATVDTAITIVNLTCTNTVNLTIETAGNLTVSNNTTVNLGVSIKKVTINGNASLGDISLDEGNLDIGSNTITARIFACTGTGTKTLTFGTNGTINITGNNATVWRMDTSGSSTVSGTGTVNLNYSGGTGTRTINHVADTGTANASFKVSAGTDIVVFTANNSIGALDFTGFSGTWTNVAFTIGGSLTVSTGMTVGAGANTVTMSSTGSRDITSNGKTLDFPLTSAGVGGTLTLQGALTLGSTRTLTLTSGTLTLNNNNLTAGPFTHTAGTVNIGSGTLTTAGAYTHTAGTVNIDSGILSVTNYSSSNTNTRTLNFGTGKLTLTGNNAAIFNLSTATNFTTSGTVYIESTYTGGTGTRLFNTGFSLAQAAGYDVKTSGSSGIVIGTTATDIVTLDGNYGNIDLTGFTNTLSNTSRTTYGTFIIPASGGTFTGGTSATTFGSTSSQTFTSHGRTIDFPLTINGSGGSLTLQDALTLGSTRALTLTAGTFNANNYNVTTGSFVSTGLTTRTLNMGSGLWSLSGTGTVWNVNITATLTLNKDTANIILTDDTVNSRTFIGGGRTYNKLTIGGATSTSTTTFTGNNTTFNEIDTTKTVAHTIGFAAATNINVNSWSINGSAGNVVSLVGDNDSTLTKLGGGYLSGYDYFSIDSVNGLPTDTWYVGANSTYVTANENTGYGFFTTQRSTRAIVVLTSTASTTWTVPADWNSANNTITLIGGGGGGGGSKVSSTNTSAGAGGGGGGCTQLTNQSLSVGASITYQAGSAGTGGIAGGDGVAGGTTSWNSGASTAGGGGGGTSNAATPSSTGGTAGTGTTFNGGVGGAGSTTTANGTTGVGGGGGAGAAGGNGAGKNGGVGFSSTTAASIAGGGGGGSNGGTAGGNASAATGGTGGNNFSGVGGGVSNIGGAVGGGSGGGVSATVRGGAGIQIFGVGSGGGGGGADDATRTNTGGTYGGGGGGAGQAIGTTTLAGSAGSQGAIIISYVPSLVSSGNFFQIF